MNRSKSNGMSLKEKAYIYLREEILENRLPPGAQLTEKELSEKMEMSRTPLREAMIKLQNENLVEIIRHKGMRILPLSPEDMREIYTVLTCVESEAAALVASQKLSSKELQPLKKATLDMENAIEADDLDAWAEADGRYHKELLGLCPNKRLVNIALNYQDQAYRVRRFTLRLRKIPIQSTQEHKDQVAAIQTGDAVKLREMFRKHRERAAEELVAILRQFKLYNI